MTEQEFRQKYPHSTDEQVRLYLEAAAAPPPVAEPDIPMPLITVPVVVPDCMTPETSYDDLWRGTAFHREPQPGGSLSDILLGFDSDLSPEQRQRLPALSEAEMLAMFFDPKLFHAGA